MRKFHGVSWVHRRIGWTAHRETTSRRRCWRASGLTTEEFAKGQDFAAGTLRWWSSRLKRAARSTTAPRFVRVVPRSEVAPKREIVLEIGAARIRVGADFDAELLARVVTALSEGSQ